MVMNYYYNSASSMNGEIFFDYLQKLNVEFIKRKRSIFLFIDDCTAHPQNLSLSNIKILFLPSNTTSVLQPMDAGIIKCFKGGYRVKLARKLISLVDSNSTHTRSNEIVFSEAVCMAYAAWNELNPTTITYCFRHCGFYKAKCIREEIIDPDYNEFNLLKSYFEIIVAKEENIDFEQFVAIGQNLCISELKIIASRHTIGTDDNNINDTNDSQEQNEEIETIISLNEAAHCLDKLKLYSLQRGNKDFSNSTLLLVNQLENKIFKEPKHYKQACFDFYFNK